MEYQSSLWSTLPKQSAWLHQISTELIPSAEDTRKCQATTFRIIEILEREMGPHLNGHVLVAGSYGKGTAIKKESDYDIVVFIPNIEPPFTSLLEHMELVLRKNSKKFKKFKWGFRSKIHLCFDVEGIKFDLAPAVKFENNFRWNRWCCFTPSPFISYPSQQYVKTLQKIRQLNYPESMSYLFSSSLSLDAVVFVQRQCPFIHSVIRLAKHWARHVDTGGSQLRGKSLLVETIAIHACYGLMPVKMVDRNLDRAFLNVLQLFVDACQLRLYVFVNYKREDIPDSVFNQTPLVLDPANPYNNLLSPNNFSSKALKCFVDAAIKTKNKMLVWKNGERNNLDRYRLMFES